MGIELRNVMWRTLLALAVVGCSTDLVGPLAVAAPSGGFLVVGNEANAFGDSMRSITYLDADDPSVPLFSVYIGREPVGSTEWEELESLTVDPNTGDVYVLAFDSGSGASIGVEDAAGDVQGDLDLLRIPFAAVYDHWAANFEGRDVRNDGMSPMVGGPAPSGIKNSLNLDYVTYANTTGDFSTFHSNQFALADVIEKVGQVARGNSGTFYGYPVEFVDSETLFVLDDSVGLSAADNQLDDHSLRIIKKVSDANNAATITTVTPGGGASSYLDGGWNGSGAQQTTESWESTLLTTLNMDGTGHSEPRTFKYYDNGSGVRGFWVVDGDFTATAEVPSGDAIGFLQIDENNAAVGWRPIVGAGSFLGIADDPANEAAENNYGKIHEVFVDANGGLVLVESGFGDATDGIHLTDQEPGVLRVSVNYDNGSGEIELGEWQEKQFLTFVGAGDYNDDGAVDAADYTVWRDNLGAAIALPNEDPNVTAGSVTSEDYDVWKDNFGASGDKGVDGDGTEFSQHSTFDPINNLVYFFSPDSGGSFNTDLHVLDLTTGKTTSYLDWDDSVSLFGDVDTHTVAYFNVPLAAGGGSVTGVPEPTSLGLFMIGLAATCFGRRRASR